MIRHYIVDGYNVLFVAYVNAIEGQLSFFRDELLADLTRLAAQLPVSTRLSVVFDAHLSAEGSNRLFSRSHRGELEVIFTGSNQTADAFIVDYIDRLARTTGRRKKEKIVLITADLFLKRTALSQGHEWMSPLYFLKSLLRRTDGVEDMERKAVRPSTSSRPAVLRRTKAEREAFEEEEWKSVSELPSLMAVEEWEKIFEERLTARGKKGKGRP